MAAFLTMVLRNGARITAHSPENIRVNRSFSVTPRSAPLSPARKLSTRLSKAAHWREFRTALPPKPDTSRETVPGLSGLGCHERAKTRTMREPDVQIGNSG